MEIKVVALKLKDKEGKINYLDRSYFDKDNGMIGEGVFRKENRQISILSESVRNQIDREEKKGLCLLKFYENITIKGLDARLIHVGQIFQIGETLQEVTSIGKKCFDGCKLFQAGERCGLVDNVIFTKIIKNGKIKIEDKMTSLS